MNGYGLNFIIEGPVLISQYGYSQQQQKSVRSIFIQNFFDYFYNLISVQKILPFTHTMVDIDSVLPH